MTVGELLGRMSSEELTEWAALYAVRADEARLADARTEAERRAKRMAGGR